MAARTGYAYSSQNPKTHYMKRYLNQGEKIRFYLFKYIMPQRGGGKCSLCGSYGTSSASCPDNPHALSARPDKHPTAKNNGAAGAPVAPSKIKPKLKPVAVAPASKLNPVAAPLPSKIKPKLKHVALKPKIRPVKKLARQPLPMALPQSDQDDQMPEPQQKIRPVLKQLLTRTQCEQWLRDPIINPLTGRLIKIGGPVFNKLKHACDSYGIQIPVPKGTFGEMYRCNNDSDPVGGEQYAQMQEDEVKNLIRLGSGMCYPLDTLYGWYKTKRQSTEVGANVSVTDPMVPSYILTDEEVGLINRYMKQQDENYVEPQGKITAKAPDGYQLDIEQQWGTYVNIHNLTLVRPDGTRRTIGTLPMTFNGGVDSYVILQKIYELWNKGLLFVDNNPEGVTGLEILDMTAPAGFSSSHWWGEIQPLYNIYAPLDIPDLNEQITGNLEILSRQLDERLG
jgi:hypothetical protein